MGRSGVGALVVLIVATAVAGCDARGLRCAGSLAMECRTRFYVERPCDGGAPRVWGHGFPPGARLVVALERGRLAAGQEPIWSLPEALGVAEVQADGTFSFPFAFSEVPGADHYRVTLEGDGNKASWTGGMALRCD